MYSTLVFQLQQTIESMVTKLATRKSWYDHLCISNLKPMSRKEYRPTGE
jgi:hypothetical protein